MNNKQFRKSGSPFWAWGSAALGLFFFSSSVLSAEVATVNGKRITEKDLHKALRGYNEGQRDRILENRSSRNQILNNLIAQELLVQQAQKEKLDSTNEYRKAMEAFRRQYLSLMILRKHLDPKLTDKAARKYWRSHKFNFSTEQVHAYHILVNTEEEAKKLLKRAKKPGADFQSLAEKYSKDPSAKNNRGDIGYFTQERMAPSFSKAAFNSRVGSIVGPVKTSFGYHVIKVVDRVSGSPLEYGEVQRQVKTALRNEMVLGYIDRLRSAGKVKLSPGRSPASE